MADRENPKESLASRALYSGAEFGADYLLKRLIALPLLLIGAVGFAAAWSLVQPSASDLGAKLFAKREAEAKVVATRFVCDPERAHEFAVLDTTAFSDGLLLTGPDGCALREEATLRFTDPGSGQHDVLAVNRYSTFMFETSERTRTDVFERVVPMVNPQVAFEDDAADILNAVPLVDNSGKPDPVLADIQVDAADVLLLEAYARMRPPPDATVRLRYSERDPEHAWIAGLIGAEAPSGGSAWFALVPLGGALWIAFFVLQAYVGSWGPRAVVISMIAIVLTSPFWAPRVFSLIGYMGMQNRALLSTQRRAPWLNADSGRRVEPIAKRRFQGLASTTLGEHYRSIVAGIIPAHPGQPAANLGDAYAQLCLGVSERLLTLPTAEQDKRFDDAKMLLDNYDAGPAHCLVRAALRRMDDAEAMNQPAPTQPLALLNGALHAGFLRRVHERNEDGARQLRDLVLDAKQRAEKRANAP
jgi:hypothetical protein